MHRQDLLSETARILEENDYNYILYASSSLDIAAQKKKLSLLIKVLENIDSLKPENAAELRKLAAALQAHPVIVGEHSKTEKLQKNALYHRHGIACLSTKGLEDALSGQYPEHEYAQGRLVVEIDPEQLRKAREYHELSLQALASAVNLSKESIYYYEQGTTRARKEIAEKIEKVLGASVIKKPKPFRIPAPKHEDAVDELSKKLLLMDFDVHSFQKIRVDHIAQDPEHKVFIQKGIRPAYEKARHLTDFFNSLLTIIDEQRAKELPVIVPSELEEIRTKQEFIRLVKEKTA